MYVCMYLFISFSEIASMEILTNHWFDQSVPPKASDNSLKIILYWILTHSLHVYRRLVSDRKGLIVEILL